MEFGGPADRANRLRLASPDENFELVPAGIATVFEDWHDLL